MCRQDTTSLSLIFQTFKMWRLQKRALKVLPALHSLFLPKIPGQPILPLSNLQCFHSSSLSVNTWRLLSVRHHVRHGLADTRGRLLENSCTFGASFPCPLSPPPSRRSLLQPKLAQHLLTKVLPSELTALPTQAHCNPFWQFSHLVKNP